MTSPKKDIINAKVMGHRGAALLAPENTLASIRAAAATGVTWVEIDVYLIGEDGLIIFHDDELSRCTNGAGVTRQALPEYVAGLDAGGYFSAEFAGEKVPTLVEALECIQSLGLGLNLEIKHDESDVENIVPPVLAALDAHWKDNDKLLISSFNHGALVLCHQLDKTRHLGQLYGPIPEDWQAQLEAIQAYSLNCDYRALTQEKAQAIKGAGYQLLCYTANDMALVAQHWEWGMDTIITDDPTRFAPLM